MKTLENCRRLIQLEEIQTADLAFKIKSIAFAKVNAL